MSAPVLLRGSFIIGEYLGVTAKQVTHMVKERRLSVILAGGTPYATPSALDDWRELYRTGKLPTR